MNKYFRSCLLCLIMVCVLSGSFIPAQAAEVSGGNMMPFSNDGIMLMSADDGIATINYWLQNTCPDGSVTVHYAPSYYTGVDTLSLKLFDIYISNDPDYPNADLFRSVFTGGLHVSGYTNGMNFLGYDLWALVSGTKYYLVDYNNWSTFTSDFNFDDNVCTLGIDLRFAPVFSNPSGLISVVPRDTEGFYYIYDDTLTRDSGADITVSWSGFEWDLQCTNSNAQYFLTSISNKLDNIISTLTSEFSSLKSDMNGWLSTIYNNMDEQLSDLRSKVQSLILVVNQQGANIVNTIIGFKNELFEKMDQEQDELINGYDPGTGTAAKGEFDSSAADLEAVEGDLFGKTSYNQVDYNQFNSFFSIEAVAGALIFVKSILESLYAALGIFGVPLTIGLVLLVFTRIIGFQNFYSGGG